MNIDENSKLLKFLQITEVDNAEIFVTTLFQRKFHSPPPTFQRHFVAFYKPDLELNTIIPVGYVHQTPYLDCHLCGGLVIDDRIYRTMPIEHRQAIRQAGGIAELLLRYSFSRLMNTKAIWGYVGDSKAEKVDLRVGFIHSAIKPIMVYWRQELSQQDKDELLEQIVEIGPF